MFHAKTQHRNASLILPAFPAPLRESFVQNNPRRIHNTSSLCAFAPLRETYFYFTQRRNVAKLASFTLRSLRPCENQFFRNKRDEEYINTFSLCAFAPLRETHFYFTQRRKAAKPASFTLRSLRLCEIPLLLHSTRCLRT